MEIEVVASQPIYLAHILSNIYVKEIKVILRVAQISRLVSILCMSAWLRKRGVCACACMHEIEVNNYFYSILYI